MAKLRLQRILSEVRASGGPTADDLKRAKERTLPLRRHTFIGGDRCTQAEIARANAITPAELLALLDWHDMNERVRISAQGRRRAQDEWAAEWEAEHGEG